MVSGTVIVVTGAGAGLGRALAVGLAGRGATVVGIGRNQKALAETAVLAGGSAFTWHAVDVSDAAGVSAAVQAIGDRYGRVDVLVNNAAVYPRLSFLEHDAHAWMHTLEINVGGVANCIRAVLPLMIQQGSGRIINVGSFADRAPVVRSSAYAASKGALHALTKAIRADLAETHSGIVCVEWIPGHMRTQMGEGEGMDPALCAQWAMRIIDLPPDGCRSGLFVEDHEYSPPRPLRQRLKERLAFWRR